MYSVTCTHDPAALFGLRDEWRDLQARSATDTIFMTWEWVTTWWSHFGQQAALWLLQARDDGGTLVGLAPLMCMDHRPIRSVRWRSLRFIGSEAPADHLDFITARGAEPAVMAAFVDALRRHLPRWDALILNSMPPYSPNLAALETLKGIPWQKEAAHVCPYVLLPENWDHFFMSLSHRKRKEQRRFLRQLDEAFGDAWVCQVVEDEAELDDAVTDLIRLHQAKWESLGKAGAFADPAYMAFFHEITRCFLEKSWLRFYRLEVDGRLAATLYTYHYSGRVYDFVSGFDYDLADFSPGQVLTQMSLSHAIEAGLCEYDFMRGDEEYKFRWGAEARPDFTLTWIASPRARLEQRAVETVRAIWQRGKRALPGHWRRRLRRLVKGHNS